MTSLLSYQHKLGPLPFLFPSRNLAPSIVSHRTKLQCLRRITYPGGRRRRCRCRESTIVRMGMEAHLPDFERAGDMLGRLEGFIYTVADAVVTSSSAPDAAEEATKRSSDWLSGITNSLETILKILKNGLSAFHVPYAYGFAIIILTVLVKALTFPLTKKQVESAMAMRSLQPQVKAIQQQYAGDQERIQIETARLYKLAGINPLAGCLPTLATIPVWIGLYRALSNVANEGLLNEGFFWIPSLSGPTTIAARQSGSGTSWLFPFVDGHPPLGWSDTLAYLVLPVLLVVSQYISAQVMQPPQVNDPSQRSSEVVTKLLPLMIGYFALSVPSGLSLYWMTNNILSTAQQIWFQKLGGAKNPVKQFGDDTTKRETSNMQKSLHDLQRSAIVETEKSKPSIEPKSDSAGLRRGERFKQIKEEEARRRKQREEGRRMELEKASRSVNLENQKAAEEFYEMANEKSENYEKNLQLSMQINGDVSHNSITLKDEINSQNDVEKDSQEPNGSSGYQASDTIINRDQDTERDEV